MTQVPMTMAPGRDRPPGKRGHDQRELTHARHRQEQGSR
jgi:hypothetical protein